MINKLAAYKYVPMLCWLEVYNIYKKKLDKQNFI